MKRTPEEARRIYDAYYEDLKKKAIAQARMPALIAELRHQAARWQDTTDPTRPLDVPECADELERILDRYDTEADQ